MEFHETGTGILEEGDLGGDKLELDTSSDEISQLLQSLQPHHRLTGPDGAGRPESVPPGLDFDLCQTDIVGGSDFVLDHSSVFDIAESVIEDKNASDFYHDSVSAENPDVQVGQNATDITKTGVLSTLTTQPTSMVSDSLCNLQIIPVDHLQIVSTINTSQGIQVIVAPRASTVGDLTQPAFLIGSLVSVPIKKSSTLDSGITDSEFCSINDQNLSSTGPYGMILNLAHNHFVEQSNQMTSQQQPCKHAPSYENIMHTVSNEYNQISSNPSLLGKSQIFVKEFVAELADNNVGICTNARKQHLDQEEIISQTVIKHSTVQPKSLFTSNPVGEATQPSTCKTYNRKEVPTVAINTNKPCTVFTERSGQMPESLYFKDKRSNNVSYMREKTNSFTYIPISKVTSVDEATQCLSPTELNSAVPFKDQVPSLGPNRKDEKIHKKLNLPISLVGSEGSTNVEINKKFKSSASLVRTKGSNNEEKLVTSRMTVSQVLELTRRKMQEQEGYRKDQLPVHPPISFKVKSRDGRIKTIHINPIEVEGFMVRKNKIYTEQTGPAVTEREHLQISKPTDDEVMEYTCDICNLSFSAVEDHTKHNETHKNNSACLMDIDKNGLCKSSHKCVANHTQVSKVELQICKRSQGNKKFRCDLCTATFSRLGNFTRHRMIHSIREEYRFKCPECGRKFLQKCDMSRHRLIHSKQEPYKCPECGKGYIRRSDLEVHCRFHKQERVFKCPHCVKSFYQSGDVSRHIRLIHKRTSQLTCGHCSRNYANESTLIRHVQSKHEDIIMDCLSNESSVRANRFDETTAMATSDDLHSNQLNDSSWLTSDLQPSESSDHIPVIKPKEAELFQYGESQSTLTSESMDVGFDSFHSAPQVTFDVEDPSIENL
ncbi:hypothetical protein CHS0354_007237 [Potamilus streckersoni]|uniref:C2H2-type domain-containing protein n=1 Tax=Potamilus streckersoni TaxID=2493646 RepID=A0AAE0VL16_9BIVA|nr:hypothetical protein CHS0354_007237 [Potamilus streckersoni]